MPREIDPKLRATLYVDESPDIGALSKEWRNTVSGLDYYLEKTRRGYDTRRNYWAGKHEDNRKHGPKAQPWPGASDMDTQVVQERIIKMVALCMRALERSHIQAFPIGEDDIVRARLVSRFLKWMRANWIKDYSKNAERSGHYWFEKGVMATHVGWEKKESTMLTRLSRDKFSDRPEVLAMIDDPANDNELAGVLEQKYGVTRRKAKRALKELRSKKGSSDLPSTSFEIDRPTVRTCAPDSDVFFPPWVMDPQRAPFVFYRELLTPQEILTHANDPGYPWDAAWADYVIEHCAGKGSLNPGLNRDSIPASPLSSYQSIDHGLIETVWMYQRLIDEETGAEGIYCTVFCPEYTEDTQGVQPYAIRYLLDGATRYPIIVTRLFDDEQRLYDIQTFPDLMRSAQNAVKAERDARCDSNGLRNSPPLTHPAGRPPQGNWAPGGRIGVRVGGEHQWAPVPQPNPQSMADEEILLRQIDRLVGLDDEDPNGGALKDYFITRFLQHHAEVLGMAYEMHQSYGPDDLMFRITGYPDAQTIEKKPDEKLDITISFDSLFSDPDSVEKMIANVATLFQFDDQGRIDKSEWLTVALTAISPIFAQQLIKPSDESVRDLQRKVVEDLTKIRGGGFEVNAQLQGAPLAIQVVQEWAQQPDVMADLQKNELFQQRLEKYVMQYVFQIQQQENAVTGRLGTPPAKFDINPVNGSR